MTSEAPAAASRARPALPSTLADRIGFRLHTTSEEVTALVDAALAQLGLKGVQYGLLALLEEQEGLSQQQAAARILVDRTTMVALVDELERQGRVQRRQDPADRRRHALSLTAGGREVVRRAHAVVTEAETRFLAPLRPEERRTLQGLLTRLDEQARSAPAPDPPS